MAATRKPNISEEIDAKDGVIYRNLYTGEKTYYPLKAIEHISRELLDYCRRDSRCLSANKFRIEKGIPRATWQRWRETYPFFKEASHEAQDILATKRYEMAAFREVDKDVIFRDQHKYDESWGAINQYHAELKNQETANTPPTVIYLPATPTTGIESQAQKKERIAVERRAKANS